MNCFWMLPYHGIAKKVNFKDDVGHVEQTIFLFCFDQIIELTSASAFDIKTHCHKWHHIIYVYDGTAMQNAINSYQKQKWSKKRLNLLLFTRLDYLLFLWSRTNDDDISYSTKLGKMLNEASFNVEFRAQTEHWF